MNLKPNRLLAFFRNGLPPGGLSFGLLAFILFAIALTPYLQTVFFGFVLYDDDTYVMTNPIVRQGLSWAGLRWAFTSGGYVATWHPLTWLSLMTDASLFGVSPGAMHLVNAVFHAASAVILLLFLRRLSDSPGASFLAAAFWAAHPLRVESVAWVCQRKDVLATLIGLLAMLAYLKALGARLLGCRLKAEVGGSPSPATAPIVNDAHQGWLVLAAALFALAFMAKPTVVTFPLLAGMIEFAWYGRVRWRHIELIVWTACCGAIVTVYTQGLGGAINQEISPLLHVLNALASLGIYAQQIVCPARLACPYPLRWPQLIDMLNGLLVCAALTAVIWHTAASRRSRDLGCGFGVHGIQSAALLPYAAATGWFVVALGPMIGIVQLSEQAHADRFTYWPSIGIALAMTWGLMRLQRFNPRSARVVWLAGGCVIAGLVMATCRQVAFWRNTETLFRRDMAIMGPSVSSLSNLGVYLCLNHHAGDGVGCFRQAADLAVGTKYDVRCIANLAWGLAQAGQLDEAERVQVRLGAVAPNLNHSLLSGMLACRRHAGPEAVSLLRSLVQKSSTLPYGWWELGNAFAAGNRWPEAIAAWRRARELDLTLTPVIEQLRENEFRLSSLTVPDWHTLLADPAPTNAPLSPASDIKSVFSN